MSLRAGSSGELMGWWCDKWVNKCWRKPTGVDPWNVLGGFSLQRVGRICAKQAAGHELNKLPCMGWLLQGMGKAVGEPWARPALSPAEQRASGAEGEEALQNALSAGSLSQAWRGRQRCWLCSLCLGSVCTVLSPPPAHSLCLQK